MTTKQIYQDYMIPTNLQEHMLSVAAMAELILEQWTGKNIDKESIIEACTFHDIAKPMEFDLAKQSQFGMSPANIDNLEKLQIRLKSTYGTDEHEATLKSVEKLAAAKIQLD